jgi:hypothetical protein
MHSLLQKVKCLEMIFTDFESTQICALLYVDKVRIGVFDWIEVRR